MIVLVTDTRYYAQNTYTIERLNESAKGLVKWLGIQ